MDTIEEPTPLDIPLSQLQLDTANPRHEPLEAEIEVVEWMTSGDSTVGKKLLNLAKDIVEHGLHPGKRLLVVPGDADSKTYVVIEGNRRVAALKLLKNPDIAPTDTWKEQFRKIRSTDFKPITSVPCVVFPSRDDADHFIELEHLGESGGAGVVQWDSIQKSRHEERKRGKSRNSQALEVLKLVQNSDLFDQETKSNAARQDFPITTLQRLLSDVDFRGFLGLSRSDQGDLNFAIDPSEAAKPLSRVVQDFGGNKKRVGDVINKKERETYMAEFSPNEVADQTKRLSKPEPLARPADRSVADKSSQSGNTRSPRYANPLNRKTVVVRGQHLPIDTKRFNRAQRVFQELRKLDIQGPSGEPKYPNAAVLLTRAMLEISIDTYISEKGLIHKNPNGWNNVKLIERTKAVLSHLQGQKPEHKKVFEVITKTLGDRDKLGNPHSIHDLVHNLRQVPSPSDVITIWDTYFEFLRILWTEL